MKNDFIKNKNNVVKKPKNNYQFIAILIICIVSVCSVLGSVFSALNYFSSLRSNNNVAYAEELIEDDFISYDFPSDYPNLVSNNFYSRVDIGGSYAPLTVLSPYSFKIEFNSMPTYGHIFFITLNIDTPTYYTTFFNVYNLPTGLSIDNVLIDGFSTYVPAHGIFSFRLTPSHVMRRFGFKLSFDDNYVFSPFTLFCSCGLWQGSFTDNDFANSVYYQIGKLAGIDDGYNLGFNDGFSLGSNTSSSLGLFSSCTFRYKYFYTSNEPAWVNNFFDYSDWDILDSQYYTPYYNGVYFNSLTSIDLGGISNDPNISDIQKGFIVADFGIAGAQINRYLVWQVCSFINNNLTITGDFGSAVAFRFTDGTYLLFNNSDDYFSTIYLDDIYLSLRLRSIEFISLTDHYFFGLMSSRDFQDFYSRGFNDGLTQGKSDGELQGYSHGYTVGYNTGYNSAYDNSSNYSFLSLIGAVVDAPIRAMTGLLNFNLLGFNMLGFFLGLLTLGVVLWVVKLLIAGKK